jgi:hypothetical protein
MQVLELYHYGAGVSEVYVAFIFVVEVFKMGDFLYTGSCFKRTIGVKSGGLMFRPGPWNNKKRVSYERHKQPLIRHTMILVHAVALIRAFISLVSKLSVCCPISPISHYYCPVILSKLTPIYT